MFSVEKLVIYLTNTPPKFNSKSSWKMVGKEDDPFLPYWGPRAMFLSFGGRVFAHGNVWLGFWGASGRLTAQFFAEKQVEMLNLVAQATLNSIIKRSQVGSTEKWWVGFHHKNPGVTMGKSTTLKIDRYIYIYIVSWWCRVSPIF